MSPSRLRKLLIAYLLLLVPIGWLATRFQPYLLDGDAVSYMDIADLLHAHRWAGAVNAYWHPLYPAVLAAAQILFHPTRWNELPAYYAANYTIFLLELAAIVIFAHALARLRARTFGSTTPLLSREALALLGTALIVIASQRELATGLVRPDALLQALMLLAFAMLLNALATTSTTGALLYPALMGLFFGLAYLTKSFAFLIALLSIAVLFAFQLWWHRRPFPRALASAALAFVTFGLLAGPYVAALSHQKHRFDFGDSGSLNYAWYAGGVEKMHLEPWMASQRSIVGPATVHLLHPEQQLLAQPGIYSYRAEPYGTYPDWFDTTFFNERIVPHLNLPVLARRDARNAVLVLRYLLNHPEALVLLALLLAFGARTRFGSPLRDNFWLPILTLGLAMWLLYALVNVEERYVTLAYLVVLLPLFATLRTPAGPEDPVISTGALAGPEHSVISTGAPAAPEHPVISTAASQGEAQWRDPRIPSTPAQSTVISTGGRRPEWRDPRISSVAATRPPFLPTAASAMIVLLAFLAAGESLRLALEQRRTETALPHPWYNPEIFNAAHALQQLGVHPGDEVACMGFYACLNNHYWARLDGVRILTEVYNPNPDLFAQWAGLPNRDQVLNTLRAQHATVLVAQFDPAEITLDPAAAQGWIRLDSTDLYAYPLTLRDTLGAGARTLPSTPATLPWNTTRQGGP